MTVHCTSTDVLRFDQMTKFANRLFMSRAGRAAPPKCIANDLLEEKVGLEVAAQEFDWLAPAPRPIITQ